MNNTTSESKNLFGKSIIIAFFLIILLIYTGQLLGINSTNDMVEKRGMQPFPSIDFKDPGLFDKLDGYFRDNYGFRNIFLKSYIRLKLNILKTKNVYQNFYNDQGFLFGGLSPENDFKKAYEKIYFSDTELNRIKKLLENEKAFFDRKGIPYFLVVIPDRRVIYNDQLPVTDRISTLRHQRFIDFMKNNTSIEVIDVTEALLKARDDGYPLYFRSDTHWTNYGAFTAYREVMHRLKKYRDDVVPLSKDDFNITVEKYDLWSGDGGLIYPENPGHPDYNTVFSLKDGAFLKYKKLGPILEYGDSFGISYRTICATCYAIEFPEFAPLIPQFFEKPGNDLFDTNPDYWRAKYNLEDIIAAVKKNITDPKTQSRIIGYLTRDSILVQPVGLDYFFRMSFSTVRHEDLKVPIDFALAEKLQPVLVIREVVDNRIWEIGN